MRAAWSHGRSKAGVELTDEVREQDGDGGRGRRRCAAVRGNPLGSGRADSFPVHLDPELRKALGRRTATDSTTASGVVREALRRYLKVSWRYLKVS